MSISFFSCPALIGCSCWGLISRLQKRKSQLSPEGWKWGCNLGSDWVSLSPFQRLPLFSLLQMRSLSKDNASLPLLPYTVVHYYATSHFSRLYLHVANRHRHRHCHRHHHTIIINSHAITYKSKCSSHHATFHHLESTLSIPLHQCRKPPFQINAIKLLFATSV